jgi:aryl-phospho-beta-D-glucosidase BglC (GH1 family)
MFEKGWWMRTYLALSVLLVSCTGTTELRYGALVSENQDPASGVRLQVSEPELKKAEPKKKVESPSSSSPTPVGPSVAAYKDACGVGTGRLTTKDGQIYAGNQLLKLKGISWMGFQSHHGQPQTMVDTLWETRFGSLGQDLATSIAILKALGFNAIRLPFSFEAFKLKPVDQVISPCEKTPMNKLKAFVTPPGQTFSGLPFSGMKEWPEMKGGLCNAYLPTDQVIERFLYVANLFAKNCFYVLIDNHGRPNEAETIKTEGVEAWVHAWQELYQKASLVEPLKHRLMLDLLNEPDSIGLGWDTMAPAYLKAMDALFPIYKDALFFVNGAKQSQIANWGDGFATDTFVKPGDQSANPFFEGLSTKAYRTQVVLSPHIYPFSVSTNPRVGTRLWSDLNDSFGRKMTQGFCRAGKCTRYAIAVGEFGAGKPGMEPERPFFTDLALYFSNTGAAKDSLHVPIDNWFFWGWTYNSSDTWNLMREARTGTNSDLNWDMIKYLVEDLGLKPWYKP